MPWLSVQFSHFLGTAITVHRCDKMRAGQSQSMTCWFKCIMHVEPIPMSCSSPTLAITPVSHTILEKCGYRGSQKEQYIFHPSEALQHPCIVQSTPFISSELSTAVCCCSYYYYYSCKFICNAQINSELQMRS
jgi:hypothetical protein